MKDKRTLLLNNHRFCHEEKLAIADTVNYIYSSWLLKSDRQHTSGPDLEIYTDEFDAVSENSVMYYAIPIKPILHQ